MATARRGRSSSSTASDKSIAEVAARKIHKPSTIESRPKMVIYARYKKGKTFFINSAKREGVNNLLIFDPEGGTRELRASDPDVWPIDDWADVNDFWNFVRRGDHEYEWFGIDGVTKLHKMALNFVRKQAEERDLDRQPGLVTKKDYGDAGQLVQQFIQQMTSVPQGVIFACQERLVGLTEFDEEEGQEESVTMKVPDLPAGVRSFLLGEVDLIGRLYVQPTRVKSKTTGEESTIQQRRLWIGDHLRYDTGFRSEYKVPPMVKNPSVPKIVSLIRGEE